MQSEFEMDSDDLSTESTLIEERPTKLLDIGVQLSSTPTTKQEKSDYFSDYSINLSPIDIDEDAEETLILPVKGEIKTTGPDIVVIVDSSDDCDVKQEVEGRTTQSRASGIESPDNKSDYLPRTEQLSSCTQNYRSGSKLNALAQTSCDDTSAKRLCRNASTVSKGQQSVLLTPIKEEREEDQLEHYQNETLKKESRIKTEGGEKSHSGLWDAQESERERGGRARYIKIFSDMCWRCGQVGHIRTDCREKVPHELFCSRCGLIGTLSKHCRCRRDTRTRSPSPRTPPRRRRSPTARPTKIHIGRLTRTVNKERIMEIFGTYGTIRHINHVEFLKDHTDPPLGRFFCFVEYTTPDEAENAVKHMDGRQVDGQEITVELVSIPMHVRRPLMHRRTPPRFRRRSPIRAVRRSPPRRRPHSRSPAPRRRKHSRSSSSSSR